jgi:hypothetical protein
MAIDVGLRRNRKATTYLVAGLGTALPAMAGYFLVPITLVFSPLLFLVARPLRALAGTERRRAGQALRRTIPTPYRPLRSTGAKRSFQLLRARDTCRDIAWLLLHGVTDPAMAAGQTIPRPPRPARRPPPHARGGGSGRLLRHRRDPDQPRTLSITERSVSKHIGNIFAKLHLPPTDSGHRRVLAVLTYLNA